MRKTDPSRGLDVAGVSMGGVVARYALAKMEEDNQTHGVANFVSIDAPQQGAIVHGTLQHDIKNRTEPNQWPPSLARPAGRQLLQYSAFDTSSPSEHDQFFAELNALNGGTGYPQLTQNVGVSFGTPDLNPNPGDRWLRLDVSGLCNPIEWGWPDCNDKDYDVVGDLGQPGSYLPREVTQFGGTRAFGLVTYELQRYDPVHPTFIPFDSALDLGSNGQSAFDLPLIHPTGTPSFHNEVPAEIVGPLLNRLGYELPAPTSVSITGPSSLALLETGTFRAVVPDPGAGYQFNWEYRVFLPGCGGGPIFTDGGFTPQDIPCGEWHDGYGSGEIFTYSSQTSKRLELRVTATGGDGSVTSPVKYVCIGDCYGGGYAASGTGSRGTSEAETVSKSTTGAPAVTARGASVPVSYALEQNYPNPFGARAGSAQTTIRFALPEASHARLTVYDALGREVARLFDGKATAGVHEAAFDAADLPGGVYLYRLTAGSYTETQRMTLTR